MSDIVDRLIALGDGTRKREAVAAELGLTMSAFYAATNRARAKGANPKFRAKNDLTQRIREFCAPRSRTIAEIAEAFGLSEKRVGNIVRLSRSDGQPIRARSTVRRLTSGVVEALDLSPEVQAWLAGQVVEGGTVDDVIRGLLVDAYHDGAGQ